jgi:predicted nucleic acid-binding protein
MIGRMPERYILDTNVIIQNPEVLAVSGSKRVVIPKAVVAELGRAKIRGAKEGLRDSLATAISRGAHVAEPKASEVERIASDPEARGLGGADLSIAALALDYAARMGKSAVVVITRDRLLSLFLSSKEIKTGTILDFLGDASLGKPDEEVESIARQVVRKQKTYLALSIILGFLASLFGNFTYSHLPYLIQTFHVWGVVIAVPIIGIALYWARERFRLFYGTFECLIGLIMAWSSLLPKFDHSELNLGFGIKLLGGLYVIVRGLDNVGKGIEGTRMEVLWKRIFRPD